MSVDPVCIMPSMHRSFLFAKELFTIWKSSQARTREWNRKWISEKLCVCAFFLRLQRRQRKKRFRVHLILTGSLISGQFYKLL